MTNMEFITLSQDLVKSHKSVGHSLLATMRHTRAVLVNFGCNPGVARMFTHFAVRRFFLNSSEVI